MKYLKITILFCLSIALFSCADDNKQLQAENLKARKQNDSILKIINNNWKFDIPHTSPKVEAQIGSWNEWHQFKSELADKPRPSIEGYRQKVKILADKADLLRNNIPPFFDKPHLRGRISVLITKVKSLYTYINISVIPDKKIISLVREITNEMISIQNQMNETVRISEIPKEMGEEEMLKALDTVRHANPDKVQQPPTNNPAPQAAQFKKQLVKSTP